MRRAGKLAGLVCVLLACAGMSANAADKYVVSFHECYGDTQFMAIHGRLLEMRAQERYSTDDGKLQNLAKSAKTLRNPAIAEYATTVDLASFRWPIKTDGEGYFSYLQIS